MIASLDTGIEDRVCLAIDDSRSDCVSRTEREFGEVRVDDWAGCGSRCNGW